MRSDDTKDKPAVLAEAEGWAVVYKPAGLLVHPSKPGGPNTLWDWLNEIFAYERHSGGGISIINRLDRETSGLTLVATRKSAARHFGLAMQNHQISKTYHALVKGWPTWETLEIDQPLLRAGEVGTSAVWLKQRVHPDGSPSLTRCRVLARATHPAAGKISMVEARPETGRLHQIRVHLACSGYPLIGDKLYLVGDQVYLSFIETGWTESLLKKVWLSRHALHASRLEFADPTGQRRSVSQALPSDLQGFWDVCGS